MNDFWAKAVVAAKSARILLAAGDGDGAVSRAYYAMFDAARAALESIDPDLAAARTHATIIRRFGKHVVLNRGLDPSLGRHLNTAEVVRLAADYERIPIDLDEAREIIEGMERLLSAVAGLLGTEEGAP
jgi:uncharacterized protein (UPF0332 family)